MCSFKPELWKWETSDDAVRAYTLFLGVLAVGLLPQAASNSWASLPYFISLASLTIYIGAHRGLNARERQQITFKQGALAPLAASAALFGGYLLVKYLPNLSLQTLFDCYFWLLGSIAVAGALAAPARTLGRKVGQPVWQFQLPGWLQMASEDGKKVEQGDVALTDLLMVVVAVAAASGDVAAHHTNHTLNNLLACLIAADILQLVGLKSFRVAAVLLLGLLAYDVFWVFGSPSVIGENVMLTVATSDVLTGPIRLLFPRIPGSVTEASFFPFSLLGLGDVAVPGLLACLALRYDASRAVDMRARGQAAAQAIRDSIAGLEENLTKDEIARTTGDAAIEAYNRIADLELEQRNRTQGISASGSQETVYHASEAVLHQRTYFTPTLLAYVAGLGAAFAANSITHLGQPALLYLVPLTLGAVAAVAASRGELDKIHSFTDTAAKGNRK
ncbi:hypothetical protein N2152v2_010691 [Parachlorella kessleri]